jgi:hypothetical protein
MVCTGKPAFRIEEAKRGLLRIILHLFTEAGLELVTYVCVCVCVCRE